MTLLERVEISNAGLGRVDRPSSAGRATSSFLIVALIGTTAGLGCVRPVDVPSIVLNPWVAGIHPQPMHVAPDRVQITRPVQYPTTVSDAADKLRYLRDAAGVTWEQLAQGFGVSRRAIHLWAAGGRMSTANEATLRRIAENLAGMSKASSEDARNAMFSLLQAERRSHASASTDVNRPAATWKA